MSEPQLEPFTNSPRERYATLGYRFSERRRQHDTAALEFFAVLVPRLALRLIFSWLERHILNTSFHDSAHRLNVPTCVGMGGRYFSVSA